MAKRTARRWETGVLNGFSCVSRPSIAALYPGAARTRPGEYSAGSACRRGGLHLAVALLVRFHGLFQIAVLLAGEEAELVEPLEMLLGVREVVEGQVRLADVLMSAQVLRIDGQRLLIDGDRSF